MPTRIEAVSANNNKKKDRAAALRRKLEELAESGGQCRDELRIEPVADSLDQLISNASRELAMAQIENKARLLRDVEAALAKIESDPRPELCEECGQPIAPKRLEAVPWARLCVQCQEMEEANLAHHQEIEFPTAA